jgi:hypothetical protein
MGLKCSPDFTQEVMRNIFRDVAEVEAYIDDIGIFSDSWKQHLAVFCIVIQKPQENGFCYLLINLFDNSVIKNISTLRPNLTLFN